MFLPSGVLTTFPLLQVFLSPPSVFFLNPGVPSLLQVFAVTAVFSVVAYLWLLIIVVVVSPGEVHIWEAVVTLAMFPALVLIAWIAEKKFFSVSNKTDTSKQIELGNFQPGESKSNVPVFSVPVFCVSSVCC